jgi:hypothetical protein
VVLVTFKSHTMSMPPYRIENQCADVYIYFVQACLAGERPGRWNWLAPARRPGGSVIAYAWDEPTEEHRLRVKVCGIACCYTGRLFAASLELTLPTPAAMQARVDGKTGAPILAEYSLDRLGTKPVLRLPTAKKAGSGDASTGGVPTELQERVASLLASESSRKVYVTVFADGPTRVLRFADVQNAGVEEAEQSVLDLAARLKQVEQQLWHVNARFSALHGAGGVRDLDLYGRAPSIALHPLLAGDDEAASSSAGASQQQQQQQDGGGDGAAQGAAAALLKRKQQAAALIEPPPSGDRGGSEGVLYTGQDRSEAGPSTAVQPLPQDAPASSADAGSVASSGEVLLLAQCFDFSRGYASSPQRTEAVRARAERAGGAGGGAGHAHGAAGGVRGGERGAALARRRPGPPAAAERGVAHGAGHAAHAQRGRGRRRAAAGRRPHRHRAPRDRAGRAAAPDAPLCARPRRRPEPADHRRLAGGGGFRSCAAPLNTFSPADVLTPPLRGRAWSRCGRRRCCSAT